MRVNDPDKYISKKELVDNSIGHGKAKNCTLLFGNTDFVCIDNGKWVNPDTFSSAFGMETDKIDSPLHYMESFIGKYNCGLTEASLKTGNLTKIMHNFQGKIKVSILDYEIVVENDSIPKNEQDGVSR